MRCLPRHGIALLALATTMTAAAQDEDGLDPSELELPTRAETEPTALEVGYGEYMARATFGDDASSLTTRVEYPEIKGLASLRNKEESPLGYPIADHEFGLLRALGLKKGPPFPGSQAHGVRGIRTRIALPHRDDVYRDEVTYVDRLLCNSDAAANRFVVSWAPLAHQRWVVSAWGRQVVVVNSAHGLWRAATEVWSQLRTDGEPQLMAVMTEIGYVVVQLRDDGSPLVNKLSDLEDAARATTVDVFGEFPTRFPTRLKVGDQQLVITWLDASTFRYERDDRITLVRSQPGRHVLLRGPADGFDALRAAAGSLPDPFHPGAIVTTDPLSEASSQGFVPTLQHEEPPEQFEAREAAKSE